MNLGDFTVVGLSENSITVQQVLPQTATDTAAFRPIGGFQQTLPATTEQTKNLFISQVVTLTLTAK